MSVGVFGNDFSSQISVFRFRFVSYLSIGYAKYMIKDVTDLEVYRLSLEYLDNSYKLASYLPQRHQRLRSQFTEAAEKIAPQIAEGFGKKRAPKEFCRFLAMAMGSSDEVITQIREIIIISKLYTRIPIELCEELILKYKILSKKLNKLLSVWQQFDKK